MFKKIFHKLFKDKAYSKRLSQLDKFEKKYKKVISDIHQSILEKKELNFLHSGHCGDLIYSFAVIKKLSITHKCNLYVGLNKVVGNNYEKHPSGNIYINKRMYDLLLPLMKKQKFLNIVKEHNNETIDINLDLFRELPINYIFNSPRWYFQITGEQVDLSQPYMDAEEHKQIKNKIIVHRTFRFRNNFINYKFLKNSNELLFIGLEDEYKDLKLDVPSLQLYNPKDFYEVAQLIKSCKFFLGNMSLFYPMAEALKVPRLLEACPEFPVVQPVGIDAYDFYFQPHFEKWFNYLNTKF